MASSPIEATRIRLLSEEIDHLLEHYLQLLHQYDTLRSSLSTVQASVGSFAPNYIIPASWLIRECCRSSSTSHEQTSMRRGVCGMDRTATISACRLHEDAV